MTKPHRRPRAGSIIVRRLTAADFADYSAIVREADELHHRALPKIIRSPAQARPRTSEFEAAIRDPDQRLFGGELNGKLCGIVHAQLAQSPGGRAHRPFRYIVVEMISVTRAARRSGVGRTLMSAVADWARSRKTKIIHLGVYEFNRAAIAFYERIGFKIVIRYMNYMVN